MHYVYRPQRVVFVDIEYDVNYLRCVVVLTEIITPAINCCHCIPLSFHSVYRDCIIIPAKARDYVFTGVGLSVCLSVCLLPR